VHRIGIKEDGTGLSPAVVAASLPDGENGVSIGSYLGYVFIGTVKGVRMASPASASGDLVLGALLPTDAPVYGFEGQDRFVWITGSSINPVPNTGPVAGLPTTPVCGLFRADLSTFTVAANTPAYAPDVVALEVTGKKVRSVTTLNDKRVFSIDGGGVYIETVNKMRTGWLEPGRISYGVEDLKTGLYCQAKWEPLDGVVSIAMSYDSATPTPVLTWGVQESTYSGNVPLNGQQFSRVDVRYVLQRDTADPTVGPITRFEIRARAVKGSASRWYLPILNHESLDINGVIFNRDVTSEFNRLMAYVESGKMFTLQEWGRTYQVVAKDFKWTPQKLDQNGIGWQGIYMLVVEEAK
jgi:predicted RNA-binding protein